MPDPKFLTETAKEVDPSVAGPTLIARSPARSPSSHDVTLQSRIWEQIRASRVIDAAELSVVVRNRSATLFGTVADEAQRAEMERIARSISGVLEVTNRLKVAAPSH
ncbi:MAG TPA: BON domain-containing protein [Polyangiaceae bacterium]|jgi:osmotically-inducible protein OsmY|nr:BON domain-containing protein [Polyangiaceae bacterium]